MTPGLGSGADGAYRNGDDGHPGAGPWLALTVLLLAVGYLVLLAL